jgi:hypothetical protein
MLAALALASLVTLTPADPQTPSGKPELLNVQSLQTDFNAAKGVPRVVIILSPS